MAWIRVIPPAEAEGLLKEEYAAVREARGAVGNVLQVTGLHPAATLAHLQLYNEVAYGESPLSRRERELIATVVSRANASAYCLSHHADAFGRHTHEPGLQALVATDHSKAPLASRERAIADHAVKLTRTPGEVNEKDVELLREAGLDDRAVLDVTLTTAYFNFVNRLASGLGVEADDIGKPYNYG